MNQMRTIEIDFEVHQAIELERTGFEESPNDVLRRLLKILTVASTTPSMMSTEKPSQGITVGKPWSGKGVELPHNTDLRMEYRGQLYRGKIEDGEWVIGDHRSNSPSDAAGSTAVTKSGTQPSLNGWNYWEVKRPQDAQWRRLKSLRPK